jgi:hypothetical protein
VESKPYYFYLWQHRFCDPDTDSLKTRICFGITGNLDNRQNGYEGHVGHAVRWQSVWSGPERLIRELESKVKIDFRDFLWAGHRNYKYEWLDESISLDQITGWAEFELDGISTVEKII